MQNRTPFYSVPAMLLCVAMTPGIGLAQKSPPPQNKPASSNPTNGHTVILSVTSAPYLFPKGTQFWTPTEKDIAPLEISFRMLAAKTPVPHASSGSAPDNIANYYRQYIGIIQGGKKMIYINAFRATMEKNFPYWRKQPVFVMDGGNGFYHVTYDVEAHRFGKVQFNGYA